MKFYPAIDLQSGTCVRLYKGQFDQVTHYEEDPLTVAHDYQNQGAQYLHLVDLDGARSGKFMHSSVVQAICRDTQLQVQVGGGIRSLDTIKMLLDEGVKRVIIGSQATSDPSQVKQWLRQLGADRIVLALDVRIDTSGHPMVATNGWLTSSPLTLWELLNLYQDEGLTHVLCTDIAKDGTLEGPNLALYQACKQRFPGIAFQASGGIGELSDLKFLAAIPVEGVIVGKALYEKKFTVTEALKQC